MSQIIYPSSPSNGQEYTDESGVVWLWKAIATSGKWGKKEVAGGGGGSSAWADITDKPAAVTALSGTNTGDETTATIKSKLSISTLSGANTGDQDLSSYATTSALTSGLAGKAPSSGISAGAITGTAATLSGPNSFSGSNDFTGSFLFDTGTTFSYTPGVDALHRAALGLVIGTNVLSPSGSGASLTALNGTQITSGNIPVARIATALNAGGNPISVTTVTASGAVTASTTGTGLSLHGGGTVTGASGAVTIAPSSGSNLTVAVAGAGKLVVNTEILSTGNIRSNGGDDYIGSNILKIGANFIRTPATNIILIEDKNQTGSFSMLRIAGSTSSFPAIKRNGTSINIRLADDSADAPLTCSNLTASGTLAVTGAATVTGVINANKGIIFPTSATGLASGAWWNNAGVLTIVP